SVAAHGARSRASRGGLPHGEPGCQLARRKIQDQSRQPRGGGAAMRLTNRRHGSKIDLQMTSMIDCVFLLLIFFMVTSSFARTERELDTGISKEETNAQQARDLAPIVVEVVKSTGGFVFQVGGRELATREELTGVLRQFE